MQIKYAKASHPLSTQAYHLWLELGGQIYELPQEFIMSTLQNCQYLPLPPKVQKPPHLPT